MIAIIKNGLTLLWQHANFQGEYDFIQNEYLYEWVFNMDKFLALQLPAA